MGQAPSSEGAGAGGRTTSRSSPTCGCLPLPPLFKRRRGDLLSDSVGATVRSSPCDSTEIIRKHERTNLCGIDNTTSARAVLTRKQDGDETISADDDGSDHHLPQQRKERRPQSTALPTSPPPTSPQNDKNSIAPKKDMPEEWLSKLVAIDCGMVKVAGTPKGKKKHKQMNLALRRVCIVDGKTSKPLLNETVRVPPQSNTPYQTRLARQLSNHVFPRINGCGDDFNVGVSPETVKQQAANIIKGRIVVGHSVDGDLAILDIHHPVHMVRDTAHYPPFLKPNGNPRSLSHLVKTWLGRTIQSPGIFHCCTEDAIAALDLYKSVWDEWENGTLLSSSERQVSNDPLASTSENESTKRNTDGSKNSKTAAFKKKKKSKTKKAKKPKSEAVKNSKNGSRRGEAQKKIKVKKKTDQRVTTRIQVVARSILYLPFQLVSFAVIIGRDFTRLVAEGTAAQWRALKIRMGHVSSPPLPFSRAQQKVRRQKARNKKKQAQRIKRWFNRIIFFFDESVLLLNILFAPVSFLVNNRYDQDIGMAVGVQEHWGIGMSVIAASLMVATRGRQSPQSRFCCLALAHYHIFSLVASCERGEWNCESIHRLAGQIGEATEFIQDAALCVRNLMSNMAEGITVRLEAVFHSPLPLILYHLTCFLWFSLRWMYPPFTGLLLAG